MELDKKNALDILKKLSVKFIPSKGTAIEQVQKAIAEKGYKLNENCELINELGSIIKFGITSTRIKILMKENVLHDGERYDSGKSYEVSEEIAKIFTEQKFI